MSNSPQRLVYDLDQISRALFQQFPQARELFLFGSRRHRTRSQRSDIDLLLRHEGYIKPSEVREFVDDTCPALDVFLVERTRAVSVINDSYIEATDFDSLVSTLSALKIWERETEKVDVDVDWEVVVRADVVFTKTVLPNIVVATADKFLNEDLVKETRSYIERIAAEINQSYNQQILDGCAVLCRRLIETLIIEVYEAKGLSQNIKTNGNYMMLEGLVNVIVNEPTFDIGRNTKIALPYIKAMGDRSAHGRNFTAKYADLEPMKMYLRDSVEALVQASGIQRRVNM